MTWQEDAEVVRAGCIAAKNAYPGSGFNDPDRDPEAALDRLTAALEAAEKERDEYRTVKAVFNFSDKQRVEARAEAAEQRVAELEAALREIAEEKFPVALKPRAIARAALGEKP